METLYPLLFRPNLREVVWGGHRLTALKALPPDSRPIGESWEVSAVPSAESVVANGALAGQPLGAVVRRYGAALLGGRIAASYGATFPLLVKFIDAQGDLSIQVHPDDTLAQTRHGQMGKAEMWYVMAAEPGATLLAGFRESLTPEVLRRRVADGSIVDSLARHTVQAGDVFFIPPGRVHSICHGILLCEIQQSSDITYRLYDYHRLGTDGRPRQLHVEAALEALDFQVHDHYRTHYETVAEGVRRVADCPFFAVSLLTTSMALHRDLRPEDSFVILTATEGACRLHTCGGHTLELRRGTSCLLPAGEAAYDLECLDGEPVKLLETFAR